jgi:hypothetical protein
MSGGDDEQQNRMMVIVLKVKTDEEKNGAVEYWMRRERVGSGQSWAPAIFFVLCGFIAADYVGLDLNCTYCVGTCWSVAVPRWYGVSTYIADAAEGISTPGL